MRYIFIAVILLKLVPTLQAQAQDSLRNRGFYLILGPTYTLHASTVFKIRDGQNILSYDIDRYFSRARGLQVETGWFLLEKELAVGLAAARELNEAFGIPYWPVLLSGRYFFQPTRNSKFIYLQIGSALPPRGFSMEGLLFSLGYGYKHFFTQKLALNFSLAYNFRNLTYSIQELSRLRFRYPAFDEYFLQTQGLEFSVGLFF